MVIERSRRSPLVFTSGVGAQRRPSGQTTRGERHPLRDTDDRRQQTRAQVIRRFLSDFGEQHSIEMWGWWVPGRGVWEIDWEHVEGGPATADVEAAIDARPAVRHYRPVMQLSSSAGAAIRFARAMLEPETAVICDTETVSLHGPVCEVAVIDACTGQTLLDTLVNPGVPIEQGAYQVHGITDDMVTTPGVPAWPTVYQRLLRITKNRTVLAYNAKYDLGVVEVPP